MKRILMNPHSRSGLLLCGLAGLLLAVAASAQSPKGEIAGVVRDPSGALVPNAGIRLRNQNTNERITASANDNGEFTVPLMPIGVYTITAQAPGFQTAERHDIQVSAMQSLRVDFSREVGEASQTLTITADTPLVDTRSVVQGMLVDDRRIRDLPLNGRNPLDLVRLIPGVNLLTTTTGPQPNQQRVRVNGGRYTGMTVLLDGGSITHLHRGSALGLPPPDALQEFKVATVGTPAEYGRGSAVISVVTRAGTNDLHGSAWEFLRNDAMDSQQCLNRSDWLVLLAKSHGWAYSLCAMQDRVLVSFLPSVTALMAQSPCGAITGRILDAGGAAASRTAVRLANIAAPGVPQARPRQRNLARTTGSQL